MPFSGMLVAPKTISAILRMALKRYWKRSSEVELPHR
jgi:hypothetical protein